MLELRFVNDGKGTPLVGHYRYEVLVNGRRIEAGRVTRHIRTQPWPKLVERLLATREQQGE